MEGREYDPNNLWKKYAGTKESRRQGLCLGVFCTATAIIVFFYLIKKKGAVFASQSNFLIPCFGILWSYLFLNEDINNQIIVGLTIILFGLYFVHRGRN